MAPRPPPLRALAALAVAVLGACGGSSIAPAPGGGAAPPPPCTTPADCPGADTACQVRTCSGGACGVENATAGTKACGDTGAGVCDGQGACVECLTEADCAATGNECTYPTCVANACGSADFATGWAVSTQVPGDCQQSECDGHGNIVTVYSAGDRPPDTTCTIGNCLPLDPVLVPTQMPVSLDTPCSENGGSWCGWFGTCVQCNDLVAPETQCPHPECLKATCSYPEGTCGTTPLDPGAACSTVSGANGTCDGAGACL